MKRLRPMLEGVRRALVSGENDYIEALYELVVVWIVSNSPLAALILIHVASHEQASFESARGVVIENLKAGEILIYVAALLAPFVYTMIGYHRALKRLPFYAFFLLLQLAIYAYCAIVFGLYRTGQLKNATLIPNWSVIVYSAALLLWYWSVVLDRKLTRTTTVAPPSGGEKLLQELGGK